MVHHADRRSNNTEQLYPARQTSANRSFHCLQYITFPDRFRMIVDPA